MELTSLAFLEKEAANAHDHDTEKDLAAKFQQGDIGAYKQLRRLYQGDIDRMVTQSLPKQSGVTRAQLKMRAEASFPHFVMKYTPDKGATFNTFFHGNMRGHLQNVAGEQGTGVYVSRGDQQSKLNNYTAALRHAEMEFGPNPTDHQILQFLPGPKTMENLQDHKQYWHKTYIGDIRTKDGDGEEGMTFADQFHTAPADADPEEKYKQLELDRVTNIMKQRLTPEEFSVVQRRSNGASYSEIALREGISSTKLRSILDKWNRIRKEEGLE